MITTVHIDHFGYVVEVFQSTRIVQLDAGRYPGTLMEVTGPIAPGMRWDGQVFVSPPPRVPPEAVADERHRRIETYFPERLRAMVTSLGGENAKAVQRYVSEVHKVAERMVLSDPPPDFKEDRHWPTPPILADIPQRSHDVSSVFPVSAPPITVSPVFNVSAPAAQEARPLVIQNQPSDRVEIGGFALDPSDPLYHRKMALIGSIAMFDERNGIPDEIEPLVTDAAVQATRATSAADLIVHESRVRELLEAA